MMMSSLTRERHSMQSHAANGHCLAAVAMARPVKQMGGMAVCEGAKSEPLGGSQRTTRQGAQTVRAQGREDPKRLAVKQSEAEQRVREQIRNLLVAKEVALHEVASL